MSFEHVPPEPQLGPEHWANLRIARNAVALMRKYNSEGRMLTPEGYYMLLESAFTALSMALSDGPPLG